MPEGWQETLKQEWAAAAHDAAIRQLLLGLYKERLAQLSQHEREQLLAELADL
jgi:hypothetical protein